MTQRSASERGADLDVVETVEQARTCPRPPLLVLEPLAAFLDQLEIGRGPIVARSIGGGHSNVTYELLRHGARVVLRRPPRPPIPPSAHDVLREARLISALRPEGVRVPRVLALCEDASLIGMPFYVMEHVDGHVLGEDEPPKLATPTARHKTGMELVDALVELHAVDAGTPSLAGFGRPDGYLERQIRRFSSTLELVSTREIPQLGEVAAWLAEHRPSSSQLTVVHGDYRLGNVMFERDRPELAAILDWEMATLGDPLADLGYLAASWAQPGDDENPINGLGRVTRQPGYPSVDELRDRYAARSGRDPGDLRFYEVLAVWKSAIFLEASYRRYIDGTTDDPYFATLEQGVPQLAAEALQRTQGRTT
jgi:aminoglycoside phosphotransferase (APT) family kinase protein